MNSIQSRLLRTVVMVGALLGGPVVWAAQLPVAQPATAPDAQPAPASASQSGPEEIAPGSPRASLKAYLDAARERRWDVAAQYLAAPEGQPDNRPELAERLKAVLDRHLWFDLEEISPAPEGRLDDGLAPGAEEVGTMDVGGARATPVRMVRVSDDQGDRWVFTRNVVRQIDSWHDTLQGRWASDWLTRYQLTALLAPGPFEIMWWQWLALLVAVVLSWVGGRILGTITRTVLQRLAARTSTTWDDALLDRIGPPIGVGWMLFVFWMLIGTLGLTVPAERAIGQLLRGVGVAVLYWGIWRLVNVAVGFMLTRPWAADSPSARNLLAIGSNLLKGVVVALGVLSMLAAFDYQVTTVLAGLGIGGLALAFGAQKTVENLFGSMALAVDQPIRVGDFVKVEDFVGTVEDIGLRSTRFRTLDRTLISIPNGNLAGQRLESFSVRDRMRLAATIGVEYRTTTAQMRQVLEGFERVLRQHPKIWPDAVVVRFKEFGASSLDIEIMAWFQVPDWGQFQLCRQEVLLGFMQVVEEAGTAFAFPTRTVHLVAAGDSSDNPTGR